MDESELVTHYQEGSKDWIYVPKLQLYSIEDDEILDLDSLSLSSNEDTWLYSSGSKLSPQNAKDISKLFDKETSLALSEYSKYVSSNCPEELTLNKDTADSSLSSSISPLIDIPNCDDSLLHLSEMSNTLVENFLKQTPVSIRKSKPTLLRNVLTNSMHNSISDGKTENAFQENENGAICNNESNSVLFKKPYHCESSEKNYVLHSVENKLFALDDANDMLGLKGAQNQFASNEKSLNATNGNLDNRTIEEMKIPIRPNRLHQPKNMLQNTFKVPAEVPHSENDENVNRVTKKPGPLCQSTPMLLSRYLKYNKSIEDSKGFSKWRISSEFTKEDINELSEFTKPASEMNVSYIKRLSKDSTDFAMDADSPLLEDETNESNLNTTYSKSDYGLNSTFNVHIEDDQISSTSESSLSSVGNKHPLSIQDVEKMAELQEQSLRRQIHSSYYGGSSKSSEVSSSNESISAFSPLSSSNEGHINSRTIIKSVKKVEPPKSTYGNQRPCETPRGPRYANVQNSLKTGMSNPRPVTTGTIKRPTTNTVNESKLSNMFKNKVSMVNGVSHDGKQTLTKKEQNTRNLTINLGQPAPTVDLKEESVTLREITPPKNDYKLSSGSIRALNGTIVKSSAIRTLEKEDPVSAKEIKGKDNELKATDGIAAGPASHIPRPSSRIPMLRSSTSTTRSRSAYGQRK